MTHESENSHFKAHDDLSGLNNSDKSQSLHDNIFRFTEHVPAEAKYLKPNLDIPFMFYSPIENRGFVDGHVGQKAALCGKAECNLFMVIMQLDDAKWELACGQSNH